MSALGGEPKTTDQNANTTTKGMHMLVCCGTRVPNMHYLSCLGGRLNQTMPIERESTLLLVVDTSPSYCNLLNIHKTSEKIYPAELALYRIN